MGSLWTQRGSLTLFAWLVLSAAGKLFLPPPFIPTQWVLLSCLSFSSLLTGLRQRFVYRRPNVRPSSHRNRVSDELPCRSLLYPAQDIHDAIVAAQAKASKSSSTEGDDDETIKPRRRSDISSATKSYESEFEGFSTFELDLTCLSRPTSPSPSSCIHLPPVESPPSSPSSDPQQIERSLSRTRSFAQQAIAPLKKTTKRFSSSAQLSSMTMPSSGSRGSWPGTKFTGRGTPIGRARNREWGNQIVEEEEVTEDGFLFSSLRSASLDSHMRPSASLSPRWSYLPPLLSATPSHAEDDEDERTERESICEPPPALAPISVGMDQGDDWDNIMKSVLGSQESPSTSSVDPRQQPSSTDENGPSGGEGAADTTEQRSAIPIVDFPMMTSDQIEELQTGLESHLGIHQALDLGLGINLSPLGGERRMNLFKLGMLPSSASGRETPSIYSQAETPRGSRAPTILFGEQHSPMAENCDQRSATSTKAEGAGRNGKKSNGQPWWRKVLRGIRKLQEVVHPQRRAVH